MNETTLTMAGNLVAAGSTSRQRSLGHLNGSAAGFVAPRARQMRESGRALLVQPGGLRRRPRKGRTTSWPEGRRMRTLRGPRPAHQVRTCTGWPRS